MVITEYMITECLELGRKGLCRFSSSHDSASTLKSHFPGKHQQQASLSYWQAGRRPLKIDTHYSLWPGEK